MTAQPVQPRPDPLLRAIVVHRGTSDAAFPGVLGSWQGLRDRGEVGAFRSLGIDASRPVDPTALWDRVLRVVQEEELDTVVLHHFHDARLGDPRGGLDRLRAARPDVFVTLSCGDAFADGWRGAPSLPKMFLHAAAAADLVFLTSMGRLSDAVAERTTAPVVLLPNGSHADRFLRHAPPLPDEPPFDVVFVGSANRSRNPLRGYRDAARRRERLVRRLGARFGDRFALFGHGWQGMPGWRGPVAFEDQVSAARQGHVVVGGVPFSSNRYYLSNRPFIQILSGATFVDHRVEGTDRILRDGDHWYLADDEAAIVQRCEELLAIPLADRRERAQAAVDHVLQHHSEQRRVEAVVRTITALRSVRAGVAAAPDLSAFLPEVDRTEEQVWAARDWPT